MTKRKMRLGMLFLPTGAHLGSWRLPDTRPQDAFRLEHYVKIARIAERGLLDFLFIADSLAMMPSKNPGTAGRAPLISHLEPLTLLSALSAVTTHIGLAGSATTTYNHPYQVARLMASLDHLSNGRAGWNLITSTNPAESTNFGFDAHPDKLDRYKRAEEFADVVIGLWNSWRTGAFKVDREGGPYVDPAGIRVLNHQGTHFKVSGPLNLPRSPQGRPVISQAGSSEEGREVAAATADIVFTAQQTFEGSAAFYKDVKARVAAHHREPSEVLIVPGVVPIVAATELEARAKLKRLQDVFDPLLGIDTLSAEFGIDMSVYPLDQALPTNLPQSGKATSRRTLLCDQAVRGKWTLRELAAQTASLGHWTLCGTPQQVADTLEHWHANGAADGFMIMPASIPGGLDDFVDLVVPELQRRGLFRTAYESTTLRGNLGLPIPADT